MSDIRNEEIATDSQSSTPPVARPYDPKNALVDIPGTIHILNLFLSSKMHESEKYCEEADPEKQRLYFATAYSIIQSFKGLMSFEDEDLLKGLTYAKKGNAVAAEHRKPAASITSRLAGLVFASNSQQAFIASMTDIERHAELVYAESLFSKAILTIMYSGDWLAFIKEALNLRTTIGIYRSLYAYIQSVDGNDSTFPYPKNSIDPHFRTGVYLGMGASHLVLSLLPSRILSIVELFGYKGDRHLGLDLLARAGGWTSSEEPDVSAKEEGLRRTLCDMALLMFHLFISGFTFDGVDMKMATRIIRWHQKRFPNGVFFLLGAGRLALMQSQPEKAVKYYQQAIDVQDQYRNLHHMSYWEMAIAYLSLWDIGDSLKCWRIMTEEASWSKAVYTYATATCLLELGGEANITEARKLLEKVPDLRQRIAGKSIPLEKYVARKAKKHLACKLDQPVTLPALELAYTFLAIAHAPQEIISQNMIPVVESALVRLGVQPIYRSQSEPKNGVKNRVNFWDDLCLARMLEGVCWRFVAFPDPDAVQSPQASPADSQTALPAAPVPQEEASSRALAAFKEVLKYGPKIELDHHLVYHTHYEMGRLLACRGDMNSAKEHFDLVLSGKPLEVNASGRKGKYSLENALIVRTSAALDALKSQRL